MLIHSARKQPNPITTPDSFMCIPPSLYMWLRIIQRNTASQVWVRRLDPLSCSSLFCWEVPLDGKRAGCSRRRLRVEQFFIQGREVIPSMQKNTKETFPSPSVSQWKIQLKRHNYLPWSCVFTHTHTHETSKRLTNVLFGCCSIYWQWWWWWWRHDIKKLNDNL